MGTYRNGAFGSFKGKVGNLVGSYWRGIPYMRSIPDHVTDPKTPAQQLQRAKFGLMMGFLKKIKPVLKAGFETDTSRRTAFNSAASFNLKNAITGEDPENLQIDFAALSVNRGPLTPPDSTSFVSENPGEVTINWQSDTTFGSASDDDEAIILLYNTTKDRALYIVEDGPIRSEESYTLNLPSVYEGDELEGYLSFVRPNGSEASDSTYLGSLTVTEEQAP